MCKSMAWIMWVIVSMVIVLGGGFYSKGEGGIEVREEARFVVWEEAELEGAGKTDAWGKSAYPCELEPQEKQEYADGLGAPHKYWLNKFSSIKSHAAVSEV